MSSLILGLLLCAFTGVISHNTTVSREVQEEAFYYLTEIIEKYGSEGLMTFEGFEHLLEHLGLAKLRIKDHQLGDHYNIQGQFVLLHLDHEHNDTTEHTKGDEHDHDTRGNHDDHMQVEEHVDPDDHDEHPHKKKRSTLVHSHDHNKVICKISMLLID